MDGIHFLMWSLFLFDAVVYSQYSPPSVASDLPQYFSVNENTTIGTEIFTLRATDRDQGDTLTFTTSTQDTALLVSLGTTVYNSSRKQWICKVILNSALDRDNSPSSRQLYFSLTDGQSLAQVRILMIINDVNDNPPRFVGLPYRTSIREDLNTGSSVFKVSATDPDSNRGAIIVFTMKSVITDDSQTFSLSTSGSLTLNKPLDYERQSFYHYNVSAKDEGDPPCPGDTCQCTGPSEICNPGPVDLFITIIDIQDTPPVFERLPYMGRVPENETVGHSILKVTATDGDRGVSEPNKVLFSLTGGDYSSFVINETDGTISVGTNLDADSDAVRDNGGLYVFTVTATEVPQSGLISTPNPHNQSSTQVSITVTDVNDNPPEFTSNNYTAAVLENTPAGVPVITNSAIEVYDKDQGSNSRFWIFLEKDGAPYLDFDTIPKQNSVIQGRSTITIRVVNSSVLDYETTKTITFKIIARENNTDLTINSSETIITLNIEDTNDNNPYFPSQQTVFNVSEDAPVGHIIANITADDVDSGDFGQVIFSLENDGHNGDFNISDEGQIQVAKPLDREMRSSHSLTVVAADSPLSHINQRRRSTLRIEIQVTDVNDHAPIWVQYIPYVSILESTSVGTRITDLKAMDLDAGLNGQIVYVISSGTNGSNLFNVATINESAVITVQQSLIDYFGLRFVQVVAMDMGSPPLNATIDLSIFVIDENQNRPVFVQPDQNEYDETAGIIPDIMVYEEQLVGSVLYTLLATDKDMGQNGLVEYYLNPATNRDYEYFTVSRVNGTLQSARRLDRETKEVYEIQVRAEDNGQPAPLSTTLTMRIKLLDINDNEPSYKNVIMPQVLHVAEEESNAYIGQIQPAVDIDSYPNNQSCYYLYGDNVFGLYLNKQTGNLYLTGKVDREITSALNTVIRASENCNLPEDLYIFVNSTSVTPKLTSLKSAPEAYNSSDASLLWVEVVIDDINDNPPQFFYHDFSTSAIYDVDIGTEVLSLAASVHDIDTPVNSKNMFELLSITPEFDSGENLDTSKAAFVVSLTGSIITNIRFKSDLLGYFLLRVLVFDNDGKNDSANIRVYLVSNLQRIKLVFNKLPNQVDEIKNSFVKKLSDILNLNLVIDKIQSHTNADGTRDPTRTDAFMHGRYRNTGKVVPASILWQLLDSNHAARTLLFDSGVTAAQPLIEEKTEDEAEELKRIFAILISILAVLVITQFLVLVHLVRLYRRRLRAATVAYVPSKEKEILEHPGTNKYFTAKNPLFGKEIKQATVDDDRTSNNSLDVNGVNHPTSTSNQQPFDLNEEQEMVLQVTDYYDITPTTDVNHSSHLDQVLQAYSNAAYENDSDEENTFGVYGGHKGINLRSPSSVYSIGSFIPGIGKNVQEGVTRFSHDIMSTDSGLSDTNMKVHLEHTDI